MAEPALRADALRNRRRILDAAADAFAESGLDVGVAEIARRAGVGAGTIFRRFPTKEDLVLAIVEERLGEILAVADEALEADDPGDGFRRFVIALTERQTRDKGFFDAAASRIGADPRLRELRDRMLAACADLLARAQQAGAIRADIEAVDILALTCGAASTPEPLTFAYPEVWRRYVAIVLDGLAPCAATSELEHPAPALAHVDAAIDAARRPGARPRTA
jgi:AcrR family transcriptional regulator